MTNMPKRISKEKEQLIEKLFGEGLIPAEITRRTNVSYGTVCGYTSVRQRINPETGNPFASLTEYYEHLARQRINPKTGERFASLTEYREHLAKQRGFASRTEYEEHLAKQKGFASRTEYEKHLAKQKGFASLTEYRE